jgi:hypothetical protein
MTTVKILKLFIFSITISATCSCSLLSLLNSGTIHVKYQVSKAKLNDVDYEEVSRLTNPSFSIRNIQHPKAYGRWNFNFRVTPSVHYDDTDYETGASEYSFLTMRNEKRPNINIKRGISMANAKFTTHTPIGAFALTGGFGGTVYKMSDGGALDTIKTREIKRIDLAWSAFLSKRFYVLAGPRYYKAGYESYIFAFRIGYFWGAIKKL